MIKIAGKACVLLILLLHTTRGYSQISISEFLGSAVQAKDLDIFNNQITYLTRNPYSFSPARELEFRTQTNELGANEQEYALRLSPANPWEIRNTKRVLNTYRNVLSLERELILKEILLQRYLVVADLLLFKEMQDLKTELVSNISTHIAILEQQSFSEFFDAEDYLELKLDVLEEKAELETYKYNVDQREEEIERLYGAGPIPVTGWDYENVISLPQLEVLVDSLLEQPLFGATQAYHQEKVELARNELALQRSDINPGFLQTSYRRYQYLENKNPFGISLGITIPVFNPNKGKMVEQRLEILEAESELVVEKQNAQEEVARLALALKNLLQRYQNLEDQLNSYDANKLLGALKALNSENPAVSLKFKAQLLNLNEVQLEVKYEIFQTYIELLYMADLLNQRPLVNYFSRNLEPLLN